MSNFERSLQSTWRPVLMLICTMLIVMRWGGFTSPHLTEAEVLKLWDVMQTTLLAGVVGRSIEKIVSSFAVIVSTPKKSLT